MSALEQASPIAVTTSGHFVVDQADPPGMGKLLATAAGIGMLSVAVAVFVLCISLGQHPASAASIGAFSGFWGGTGFGALFGGAIYARRHLDE